VLRLVSLLAVLSLGQLEPGANVGVAGYQPPELKGAVGEVAGPWLRADALWYLKVATQGYSSDDGTLAFFPAFPALTRVVDHVVGNEAIAGLLVANLASWLGLVLLFGFVRQLLDSRAARTAVFGTALFPTAFFFVAPYGEPVLLAAGSAALLFALRGEHAASFAAGAVAALSRPFGFALAIPVAAIVLRGHGRRRWLAPAGPLAGIAGWAVYAWRLTGDPMALVNIQENWQRELTPFWETLWAGFTSWRVWDGTEYGSYFLFDIAATLFGLALGGLVIRALRKTDLSVGVGLAAYGGVVLLLPLSLPFLARPLLSNPRFVLALFPLFVGLIVLPGKLRVALGVLSAMGLFVGTLVYLAGRPLY